MKPAYNHVCLTVGDIDRSVAFYKRYFGLKPVRRDPVHAGPRVSDMTGVAGGELKAVFLSDGDFVLELIQFLGESAVSASACPTNQVGAVHLGFVCDDVRAAHSAWSAEGVRLVCDPIYSAKRDRWSIMLRDPDGIMIEMLEHAALTDEQMATARS